MCIYTPKRYVACSHPGSQTDLVATKFCILSRSAAVSSPLQRCPAARPAAAGAVFAAPGLCPPCQAQMEASNVNPFYSDYGGEEEGGRERSGGGERKGGGGKCALVAAGVVKGERGQYGKGGERIAKGKSKSP